MLGVTWLVKQNSVRCTTAGNPHAQASKGGQAAKVGRGGIQSPPQPSPLKLKRSASFIEASPAKGSLIVEQRKREWALQQKLAMAAATSKTGAAAHGNASSDIQMQ